MKSLTPNAQSLLLPIQFHGELELTWIIGCGGGARVAEERAYGRHVVSIGNVEHVRDQVHAEALVEVEAFCEAYVIKDGPWSHAGVASQVAVELQEGRGGSGCGKGQQAWLLQDSTRRILGVVNRIDSHRASRVDKRIRPAGERRQLKIVVVASDDIEWPPRAEFNQRSKRPIAEKFAAESVAAQFTALVD